MNTNKIASVYATNTKANGDTLSGAEWTSISSAVNDAQIKINSLIDDVAAIPANNGEGGENLPNLYINNKGNLNLETSATIGNTSKGKINIESMDDIQLKPGDDIILYSHHRAEGKQDEVAVKVTDGDDIPVKLQLNAAEMTISTKDKTGEKANVFDINVNSDKNTKGYLKVRAQAIDLRCEEHGGIALQPKGYDNEGNMNKIKFEHGSGDGLEFGTFNTEKTSIFTDEYRFNKDGVWKMATREKVVSDKADVTDNTTAYKYQKQADDFYDIIDSNESTATTEDIIKTAHALNNDHTSTVTSRFGLTISSTAKVRCNVLSDATTPDATFSGDIPATPFLIDGEVYTLDQLATGANQGYFDVTVCVSVANLDYNNSFVLEVTDTTGGANTKTYYRFTNLNRGEITFRAGRQTVTMSDIATLVDYFKNDASDGPWANV